MGIRTNGDFEVGVVSMGSGGVRLVDCDDKVLLYVFSFVEGVDLFRMKGLNERFQKIKEVELYRRGLELTHLEENKDLDEQFSRHWVSRGLMEMEEDWYIRILRFRSLIVETDILLRKLRLQQRQKFDIWLFRMNLLVKMVRSVIGGAAGLWFLFRALRLVRATVRLRLFSIRGLIQFIRNIYQISFSIGGTILCNLFYLYIKFGEEQEFIVNLIRSVVDKLATDQYLNDVQSKYSRIIVGMQSYIRVPLLQQEYPLIDHWKLLMKEIEMLSQNIQKHEDTSFPKKKTSTLPSLGYLCLISLMLLRFIFWPNREFIKSMLRKDRISRFALCTGSSMLYFIM